MIGCVTSPAGTNELNITLQHNGQLRFSKPGLRGSHDAICTSVYGTLGQIMGVLLEIGSTELNVLNGTHLFEGRMAAPCEPIPEDIFHEFTGRLRLFIERFLATAVQTT